MNYTELLRTLEMSNNAAVALGRNVIQVGCFKALLHPSDAFHGFNYAVPLEGANNPDVAWHDLETLREVFASHARQLRFEFTLDLWPELPRVLERGGLNLESQDPAMLLLPNEFTPTNAPNISVHLLQTNDSDELLAHFLETQSAGFGYPKKASNDEILSSRAGLSYGRANAFALIDDQPAGAGSSVGIDGIAELAGISTLPEFRRRGVASAVSSALCQDHFSRAGKAVWLSAGDDAAQACYERLGFRVIGMRVNYS